MPYDALLRSLHADPRFQVLLARMGLSVQGCPSPDYQMRTRSAGAR